MSDKMREALETLKVALRFDDPNGHYDLVCEALAQAEQRGEVAYWAAVDGAAGSIELGMSANDGNGGEFVRQEVNDFINEAIADGEPLRLVALYTAPPAPVVPSTWPKIEHPNRPAEADSEAKDLQRRIAESGVSAIASTLRIYALTQPSRGSFAGSLWAMYECLAATVAAPPAPVVPEGWREFIAECATFAGKMVNGNRLSERAAGLLADAPEVPRG